jgi:hypothetical protein
MLDFKAHQKGLLSAIPEQGKTALRTTSEAQSDHVLIPGIPNLLSKSIVQGGGILVFLILLWMLLQQFGKILNALTELVKAIK